MEILKLKNMRLENYDDGIATRENPGFTLGIDLIGEKLAQFRVVDDN